jgi:hypothetical protein
MCLDFMRSTFSIKLSLTGYYSTFDLLRLFNRISDLVECTFLQISDEVEGEYVLDANLVIDWVLSGAYGRSLILETIMLSQTGRSAMI